MNSTRIEKSLDLTLAVDAMGYRVDSFQPECGDSYRLYFSKLTDSREEIVKRIGEEIFSWLSLMDEELADALNEDECGK